MIRAETLQFLRDLGKNNSKAWVDANRDRWDATRENFIAIVNQFIDNAGRYDARIATAGIDPRRSFTRLNRDPRTRHGRPPYKTFSAVFANPGSTVEAFGYYNSDERYKYDTYTKFVLKGGQGTTAYETEVKRRFGVEVRRYFLQRMTTKWGSCNSKAGTIRLNTELVKKPRDLLEYVIVHEMIHILEPNHSPRFFALLSEHYPSWPEARQDLNELPVPQLAGS